MSADYQMRRDGIQCDSPKSFQFVVVEFRGGECRFIKLRAAAH